MISRGVSREAIQVTGQPRFDKTARLNGMPNARTEGLKILETAGIRIAQGVPTVVVVTQPWVEYFVWTERQRKDFLDAVVATLESLRCNVIFKLHPQECMTWYKRVLPPRYKEAVIRDVAPRQVLVVADVVLAMSSTVVVEALLLGKAVVFVDLFDELRVNPYVERNLGISVKEKENLTVVLRRVLEKRVSPSFDVGAIESFAGPLDGKASDRVCELIVSMLLKAP